MVETAVRKAILVAEDNSSIRTILCHILQQAGFDTAEAKDGKAAVEYLERDRVDLVVLDVMMPRIDGFTACRMIKSNPRFEDLPVVICTSRDRKSDVLRAISAGADDYIVKPFNRELVISRIKRALVPLQRRAEASPDQGERRSTPRVRHDWSATLILRRNPVSGSGLIFKNRIRNISTQGLGVSHSLAADLDAAADGTASLKAGQEVDVVLEINPRTYVEVRGRIIHVTPEEESDSRMLVGVAFTDLPESTREIISNHTY